MNKIIERIGSLLYKLWSIKGAFAVLASAGLFLGKLSEITFTLAWATLIGSRELWKHLKGETQKPLGK
jgi:hypothetical protein